MEAPALVELQDRVAFEDPTAARIMEIARQAVDLPCTLLIRGHSSLRALPSALGMLLGCQLPGRRQSLG
jgi:hypothetical protein